MLKSNKIHARKRYYLTLTICLNVNARGGSNIPTSFFVVSDSTAELTIVFALDSPVLFSCFSVLKIGSGS